MQSIRDRLTAPVRILLAASALAGFALVSPGGAAAKTPDCFDVDFEQACFSPVDSDFTDTVLCDFPVDVHVSGSIRYRPFFAGGDLSSEEFHFLYRATIVNPATGRSFVDGSNFNQRATFLPDGSVEIRETGIQHNAQVDDGRRLFHQSGNHSVLIDPDDQTISEVFHGNWQSEAAFPGQVCPILAQP
jgi:hypothetical protein